MKTKVLLTFWDGGNGHLGRVLKIAKDLSNLGYEIGIISSNKHLNRLRQSYTNYLIFHVENRNHNVTLPPYSLPIYSHAFRHAQRLRGLKFDDIDFLNETIQQELDIIRFFRPSIIINDYRDTILISAEITGVPIIGITQTTGNTSGYSLGWWVEPPEDLVLPCCLDSFNKIRRRYGLKEMEDERESFEGNINIIPSSDSIDPFKKFNVNNIYVGLLNGDTNQQLANRTYCNSIFCYLGEGNNRPFWDFDSILSKVTKKVDAKFIITGSKSRFPKVFEASHTCNNISIQPFWSEAQYESILSTASVVICHGGSTAMRAISLGIPVIFIPWNSEPSSALFVSRFGAGIYLNHSNKPLERRQALDLGKNVEIMGHWESDLSEVQVANAIETLLTNSSYRIKVQELAKELSNYNSTEILPVWVDKLKL